MQTRLLYTLLVFYLFTIKVQAQNTDIHFRNALDGITVMLSDRDSTNFKKAVFLTENAYYEN